MPLAKNNLGYDPQTIEAYRAKMIAADKNYWIENEAENTSEYASFYFIGQHEGREVIYDAAIYTLRLQHESELYEIAEHRAANHFPDFKKITYDEDENGNLENLDPLQEEIGLFMAEVIMELEEEGSVRVKEHIDMDMQAELGIGLDIGLHVDKVTHHVIERFIKSFNDDTIILDETLYTFQTHDQESE